MRKLILPFLLLVVVAVSKPAFSYIAVDGDYYALTNTTISMTALTAADTTNYVLLRDGGEITWAYTISSLSGGGSVTVRLEGSVDAVHWFNLDPEGDRTHTANGTSAYRFTGIRTVPYSRFRVVSISGTASISSITAKPR